MSLLKNFMGWVFFRLREKSQSEEGSHSANNFLEENTPGTLDSPF